MADLADVQDALTTVLAAAVYPNGTAQPSVITAVIRIFPGWPSPEDLDRDLAAGTANISVFSQPNVERNTTRFEREFQQQSDVVHTLTASVAGNVITIGGTNPSDAPAQWVTAALGSVGQQKFYSYPVTTSQSLAAIATGLAALINADQPAAAVGAVITITTGKPVAARIGSTATLWRELARVNKGFQITLWCGTPAQRAALAKIVVPALCAIIRLPLADGSSGHMVYTMSRESDEGEKSNIFRRDLFFSVDFPISDTGTAYEVTAPFVASVTPAQSI
jgi:hypothetical protein